MYCHHYNLCIYSLYIYSYIINIYYIAKLLQCAMCIAVYYNEKLYHICIIFRILQVHLPGYETSKKEVQWHIEHKRYNEMSKKSTVVSLYACMHVYSYNYAFRAC